MENKRKKIIERIKKLLAVTEERGATEREAVISHRIEESENELVQEAPALMSA